MILALSGWKGSGKDTVSNILVQKYGFRRIAFADMLKDMVSEQYGIDRKVLDNPEKKEMAILNLPVDPKDSFSEMIASFFLNEFRTENNLPPTSKDQNFFWTPRTLCILEGSVKRSVNSQYWVNRALSKILGPEEKIVITDLRYRSEVEQIISYGNKTNTDVLIARVERFDSSPSQDASERDLDSYLFDLKINNTGRKEQLENTIDFLVQTVLK